MKTTVDLPDALLLQVKREAERRGTTLRAVLEEGLRAVLEKAPVPRPFRLRKAAFRGRGLKPSVEDSWEGIRRRTYEGRGE